MIKFKSQKPSFIYASLTLFSPDLAVYPDIRLQYTQVTGPLSEQVRGALREEPLFDWCFWSVLYQD
jgi:hypothetical protein